MSPPQASLLADAASEPSSSRLGGKAALRAPLVQALRLDPRNAAAYCNLAQTLCGREEICVFDEKRWSARTLLMYCLELRPQHARAYQLLASTLGPVEETLIPKVCGLNPLTGAVFWGRRELYLKALHLDPTLAEAFNNLGAALAPGEVAPIKVDDDTWEQWDAMALYNRAIALNPKMAQAYSNLAAVLQPHEAVSLPVRDCEPWSPQRLFVEAIRLDGCLGMAYSGLAELLCQSSGRDSVAVLSDGSSWPARDLYIRAIELDPTIIAAFTGLASLLAEGDIVRLRDESTWSKKQLLVKAQQLERQRRKGVDRLTKERWGSAVTGADEVGAFGAKSDPSLQRAVPRTIVRLL
eukprot:TRINITY_DN35454_c0_g1_i1.p1 TRINITY_DN35454_c0_g1~~TRINITY_DN35454_c0_g1_i1.p1  ORF type:complete len:352 (+),score=77.77 TRINITY_DN35454_c0_g1_i1:70-1125(+)